MSRHPFRTAPIVLRVATQNGQRGLWDGKRFWPLATFYMAYVALETYLLYEEAAVRDTGCVTDDLALLWWRWGHLGRLLTQLGQPPDPSVPHRVEIIAPQQAIDSIHCWTCDDHLERPLTRDSGAMEAWYRQLRTFAAQHGGPEVQP